MARLDVSRTLTAPDGAVLAYRRWRPEGPRRTVVLLHGLASNATRWSEFVATTRLRASWDLLRPDLRGFAGSLCRGRVGIEEWCRDLLSILKAETAGPAALVGHCLGANLALHFAARQPAMVRGLVLIEPMLRQALTGRLRLTATLSPLVVIVAALVRGLNALGIHRRRLATIDLERLDGRARAVMAASGPGAFPEELYGSPWEDLRSTPTAAYLAGLLAVTSPLPDLGRVRAPALALLSSGGAFGDVTVTARALASLPTCRVRVVEARHWIPTECPDDMREAIDGWCEQLLMTP